MDLIKGINKLLKHPKLSDKEIIEIITTFYKKHKRWPSKDEV
jgi:hypothetical protein